MIRGRSFVGCIRTYSTSARLRRSDVFIPIQASAPNSADAPLRSQQLTIQGGVVDKVGAGIYTLLPLGLRAMRKLESVIDQEMASIRGQKIAMPNLIPASLWKKTGRWESAGKELFRLKDRKDADFCLGPTHEEVVTGVVSSLVHSYKQLPLRLYQITSKFRDEVRPRYGLMRGREFLMKDMYSFDKTQDEAYRTYEEVREAYKRVFSRLGLKYVIAEADSGNIGGNRSHEFHLISAVGEDVIFSCSKCDYSANVERAKTKSVTVSGDFKDLAWEDFSSCQSHLYELVTRRQSKLAVLFVPQRFKPNPLKVKAEHGADDIRELPLHEKSKASEVIFLADYSVLPLSSSTAPSSSPSTSSSRPPSSLSSSSTDPSTSAQSNSQSQLLQSTVKAIIGDRRFSVKVGDFRSVEAGDGCPCQGCAGQLQESKGIEVGHIFYLGKKYSDPLRAVYKNSEGTVQTIEMGCYGLGLSRILASSVEILSDSHGLVWPLALAPYRAIVIPLGIGEEQRKAMKEAANDIYDKISSLPGFEGEVLLEDREDLTPGLRMNEARFLGFPWVILLGKSMLKGLLEVHERNTGRTHFLSSEQLLSHLQQALNKVSS